MADLNAAFEAIDAVLFSLLPRVGKILCTTENVNPSTYIPNTTWAAWGSGRMPVGVDAQQTEFNSVEKIGGESAHTLTQAELPSYDYPYDYATSTGGGSTALVLAGNGGPGAKMYGLGGSNQAHNNLPPYITCYMWKRTA